jgi:acetyl-CoA synthetase
MRTIPPAIDAEVQEIRARWNAPDAALAALVCDHHPPNAVALVIVGDDGAGVPVTYAELRERSALIAGALGSAGIGAGDRVASLMGKGVDLVALMIGIWRIGAVYAPLFTAFAGDEVALRLEATGAKLVVADAAHVTKLNEGGPWQVLVAGEGGSLEAACAAADPVRTAHAGGGAGPIVHMLTSGTTGRPKGVVHPLSYVAGWEGYLRYALSVGSGDRYWCIADPGWAYGLYTAVITPLALGIPTHLQPSTFSAQSATTILRERQITDFAAAPTVLRAIRASGVDVSGLMLRRVSTAGEPLTPDVNEWTREALGLEVRDHFGQTEIGMCAGQVHHPELARPVKPASMGPALPGWSLVVLDRAGDGPAAQGEAGRLAVDVATSPFMTFGGYQPPTSDRFTADGRYYLTGDTARVDADGDISFGARDDDVIIMAGYRISPVDVESVLLQHPAVADCAVVSIPDEVRGEVIKAVVVLERDGEAPDDLIAELRAWVKSRYGAHAAPATIEVLDALPRTPSGKVKRFELRGR